MTKTRLLLSLLTVFAMSAIAPGSASAALQWHINGVEAYEEGVTYSGGTIEFEAAGKAITCTAISGKGTVTENGTGNANKWELTGCTTNQAGCLVKTSGQASGHIVLANVPDKLILTTTSSGKTVVADEFTENSSTKEIGTLEFTAEPGKSCSHFGTTTKIKGHASAEVNNTTQVLDFPNPELEGNTLEAFGVATSLTGSIEQDPADAGKLAAVEGIITFSFAPVRVFKLSPQAGTITITNVSGAKIEIENVVTTSIAGKKFGFRKTPGETCAGKVGGLANNGTCDVFIEFNESGGGKGEYRGLLEVDIKGKGTAAAVLIGEL